MKYKDVRHDRNSLLGETVLARGVEILVVGTFQVQLEECRIMEADDGDVFHDQGSLDRGGGIGVGDGKGHGGCNGQPDRAG